MYMKIYTLQLCYKKIKMNFYCKSICFTRMADTSYKLLNIITKYNLSNMDFDFSEL